MKLFDKYSVKQSLEETILTGASECFNCSEVALEFKFHGEIVVGCSGKKVLNESDVMSTKVSIVRDLKTEVKTIACDFYLYYLYENAEIIAYDAWNERFYYHEDAFEYVQSYREKRNTDDFGVVKPLVLALDFFEAWYLDQLLTHNRNARNSQKSAA